ncbi:hypothetical protein U1Q18_052177 [Sarracenia purpurea var. burkii]
MHVRICSLWELWNPPYEDEVRAHAHTIGSAGQKRGARLGALLACIYKSRSGVAIRGSDVQGSAMFLNCRRRTHISDVPEEVIERIAATIITGKRIGARDVFAFAGVCRCWTHVATHLSKLVAKAARDVARRDWQELDEGIGIDHLHVKSRQSNLLRDAASNSGLEF